MSTPEQPSQIGPYAIVRRIGAGGMGEVYEGIHPVSGRRCAIKTVLTDGWGAVDALRALRREVQVLADLDHPHIVKVLDHDLESDNPWFAMEYIEGRPFSEWNRQTSEDASTIDTIVDIAAKTSLESWESLQFALTQVQNELPKPQRQPVTPAPISEDRSAWQPGPELRSKLSWIGQVSRALEFLHGLNMVHGDVKPDNVLIRTDGTAVLVDFGLVSRKGRRVTHTALDRSLTRAQTLEYAAPERFLKADYDARADLYAIGCMLFEAFAGAPPFTGPPSAVAIAHAVQEPPLLDEVNEPPPPALAALIDALLRKDPLQRTAYFAEVCSLLEDYAIPTTAAGRPVPAARPFLYQPGFVGLDAQIDEASRVVRGVNSQQAAPVLQVVGPAGSGKSRFLLEVAAGVVQTNAHVYLVSSDDPGDERQPFASMRFVLDHLVDRCVIGEWQPRGDAMWLARLDPRIEGYLTPHDRELLDQLNAVPAGAASNATALAFVNAIRELGVGQPIVILVEALDQLEKGSRAVVDAILKRSHSEPWLLIATTTDVLELGGHDSHVIELPALDDKSIAMFVAQMLGGAELDQETVDLLRLETGGRPASLLAFVHVLLDHEMIEQTNRGRWRGANGEPLSTAARRLIRTEATRPERRIARLQPDVRRVAEVCAVLGRTLDLNDVLEFEGMRAGRALTAISQLLGSRLLVEGRFGDRENTRDLAFVSREIRSVLYDGIRADRREGLHRAAARIMQERDDLPSLAQHLEAAGELPKSYEAWLAAEQRTRDSYVQKLHIRCIEGALRVGRDIPDEERENLLFRRLSSIYDVGSTEVIRAESESFLEVARLPATRAKILFLYGGRMLNESRPDTIEPYIEELNSLAHSDDPSASVPANTVLRAWHAFHGRVDEAIASGQRAVDATSGIDNVLLELQAIVSLGNALFRTDRIDECLELAERAVELARKTGTPHKINTALSRVVAIRAMLGHFADVRRTLAPIMEFQRKTQQTTDYLLNLYNVAYADHVLGRFNEALEGCELMKSVAAEYGVEVDQAEYLTRSAVSLGLLGRQSEALSQLDRAVELSRTLFTRRHAEFEACNVLLGLGQPRKALQRLESFDEAWVDLEDSRQLLKAQCYRACRDFAAAARELGLIARNGLAPYEIANLDAEWGRLELARGKSEAGRHKLETTLHWFDAHEFAYDSAMIRIELAIAFDGIDTADGDQLQTARSYLDSQPFEATAPIRLAFAKLLGSNS